MDKLFASEFFDESGPPVVVKNSTHEGKTGHHSHEFYEMVFVATGYALHSCDGTVGVLTAGDIFIVPPDHSHSYISASHALIYNCLFRWESFSPLIDEVRLLPGLEKIDEGLEYKRVHADMAARSDFELSLERIKWEQQVRGSGWRLKVAALFFSLLVEFSRIYEHGKLPNPTPAPGSMRIVAAVAAIENGCRRDMTVEEIAREAGMSVSQLNRQFKALIGMSPMEYARSFRIAKAAELIRASTAPISSIAEEMGFDDISVFSRQFKHITGQSPSEVRKRGNG